MSEDQLQPQDTLDDRGVEDVLDEGYSPPDREPKRLDDEDSLDERLAQEEPEPDPYVEAERASADLDRDDEAPDPRAGRLVAPDEGVTEDVEKDAVAEDVGIDGGAAAAEEAAVHVIEDGP